MNKTALSVAITRASLRMQVAAHVARNYAVNHDSLANVKNEVNAVRAALHDVSLLLELEDAVVPTGQFDT